MRYEHQERLLVVAVRLLAISGTVVVCWATVNAAEEEKQFTGAEVRALGSQMARAQSSKKMGLLRRKLLNGATPETLRALAFEDTDMGLAFSAYWRMHKVDSHELTQLGPQPENASSVARFCGFFEGKTKLPVPEWWQKAFISGYHEKTAPAYRKAKDRIRASRTSIDRISTPSDTTMEKVGDAVVIAVGNDRVKLPLALFDEIRSDKTGSHDQWTIKFREDRCYLVTHDHAGSGSRVYHIDPAANKIVWACDLWALGTENLGGISGSWWHDLEAVLHQGRLFVFGAGPGAVYVEAFDANTGKCEFRFAENNWNADSVHKRLRESEPDE